MSTELIDVQAELTNLRNDIQHSYEEEEKCLVNVAILVCVITENLLLNIKREVSDYYVSIKVSVI